MLSYVLHRMALSVVVLFGLLVATFFIIHLVPGDPVTIVLAGHGTPQAIAETRHELWLDRPLLEQFWLYLSHTLQGEFGTAFTLNAPVGELIGQRVAPSAIMIGYGILWALVIGVPLAVIAALRPNGIVDNTIRLATTFTFAMASFWLGLMLALLLGLELHIFPVSGYETGFSGIIKTMTLPALTLGLGLAAVVVRTLRSSLLEVLSSEYIDAARSRGLSEVRVVGKHAMRNSLMNTITILSVNVGFLIGGTFVLEQVFQIPGVGSLLLQGVQKRDYQLVQALALLSGTAVVLAGLAADILQAWLDPRVRLARR
ncbi:ABC transporter permease [Baekduia sp. Peel2402]|uniref:ABC transporter permease n=1 Tax=Baekduia sp. Peel2402 TaxID=3458296 RepID=UPI00403EC0B9